MSDNNIPQWLYVGLGIGGLVAVVYLLRSRADSSRQKSEAAQHKLQEKPRESEAQTKPEEPPEAKHVEEKPKQRTIESEEPEKPKENQPSSEPEPEESEKPKEEHPISEPEPEEKKYEPHPAQGERDRPWVGPSSLIPNEDVEETEDSQDDRNEESEDGLAEQKADQHWELLSQSDITSVACGSQSNLLTLSKSGEINLLATPTDSPSEAADAGSPAVVGSPAEAPSEAPVEVPTEVPAEALADAPAETEWTVVDPPTIVHSVPERAQLVSVDIGADGIVFGVDSYHNIYRLEGHETSTTGNGHVWEQVDGFASKVSVGNKAEIAIIGGAGNQIYKWNVEESRWSTTQQCSAAIDVAMGSDGTLCFVDEDHKIFRYNESGEMKWEDLPLPENNQTVHKVTVGNRNSIVVVSDGEMLAWSNRSREWVNLSSETQKSVQDCNVAADGTMMAVDSEGGVYKVS